MNLIPHVELRAVCDFKIHDPAPERFVYFAGLVDTMVFKNIKTEFGAIQKAVSELDIADGQFTNSITGFGGEYES